MIDLAVYILAAWVVLLTAWTLLIIIGGIIAVPILWLEATLTEWWERVKK